MVEIEPAIEEPTDIRWDDADHVLVADRRQGVARVRIDQPEPQWLPEWPHEHGIGSEYIHLGVSPANIAVADIAFGIRWCQRAADASIADTMIEFVADLDLHGDRLLVSGLRRDESGSVGGDGSIAWVGSLREGLAHLKPILPFRNKAAIQACAGFGLGAVRFLGDGSFLIVPGSEPGVYLYGVDGHLARTWDTAPMNLDVNCDLAPEQRYIQTDPDARETWLNARRIVDDAFAIDRTPALVVRSRTGNATRWELITLRVGGFDVHPLPFTSSSPWSHLSCDYRDGKLVFLIADRLQGRAGGSHPRIVVTPWPLQ